MSPFQVIWKTQEEINVEQENFILKIRSLYNQFTKVEKKVADYVLQHPDEVVYMSINDLADACQAGETSVYRFCRDLGVEGYQDFKMKLSLSISKNKLGSMDEPTGNVTREDSISVLAQKTAQTLTNTIAETLSSFSESEFLRTIEMIEEAENFYFFGIGDSLLTAMEASNTFMRVTKKVHCLSDPHLQAMTASMMTSRDLVIAISYSGSTKDTVHAVKLAKEAGAKIACITRFIKSPLTVYADAVLLCGSNEGPLQAGSTSGKISQLFLVDLLFSEYYRRTYTESKENIKKTSRSVLDKLY